MHVRVRAYVVWLRPHKKSMYGVVYFKFSRIVHFIYCLVYYVAVEFRREKESEFDTNVSMHTPANTHINSINFITSIWILIVESTTDWCSLRASLHFAHCIHLVRTAPLHYAHWCLPNLIGLLVWPSPGQNTIWIGKLCYIKLLNRSIDFLDYFIIEKILN